MKYFLFIFLCVFLLQIVLSKKVGLFASTGTFSHDLMMYQVGETLSARGFEVVWVQIKVFEFNRTLPTPKYQWRKIIYDDVSTKSVETLRMTQRTIWQFTSPLDLERMDIRGTLQIGSIYDLHQESCATALKNRDFLQKLFNETFDLIVVDYILHECGAALASFIDCPVIYMSNYPTTSSYVENINVPSNPASVPSVLTSHSTEMSFFRRVKNTLAFLFMVWFRRQMILHTTWTFWWNNMALENGLVDSESEILYFGTPFEFMLESSRPISHQIKHMGCSYATKTFQQVDLIKELNLTDVSPNGVVLVSFGSVTSGEHIPKKIIRTFLNVFGNLTQTVIWQFGSHPESIGMDVPKNVHLYSWLPLQKLLANPRIKLLVGHGGIRSLLEAVHQNVPVVGIPIQGCQPHDLKRVVDKGAAEIIEIPYLTEKSLSQKINNVLENLERFKENTKKLSELILSYNLDLAGGRNLPDFWLTWAVNHGQNLKRNGRFTRNSYVPVIQYYYLDFLAAVCVVLFLTLFIFRRICYHFSSDNNKTRGLCITDNSSSDKNDETRVAGRSFMRKSFGYFCALFYFMKACCFRKSK